MSTMQVPVKEFMTNVMKEVVVTWGVRLKTVRKLILPA